MDFLPHATVAGRYRLLRMVGAGGMGEVWSAEDAVSKKQVALKRLLPAAAKHHEVVARFRREAFLLGRVNSEFAAKVLEFLEDESYGLVLVMEFVQGQSLAHILEDHPLSVPETIDLAVDLLHALCDLHDAKIVHRDLKPGNIIMRPIQDRGRAIVVDFGISRIVDDSADAEVTGITRANIALGTVEYMAPEQILSSRDVTHKSDLYAVGVILFRSVAGHHAFGDRRGEELARAKLLEDAPDLQCGSGPLAQGLSRIVARALKKRPAQRYTSAREMLVEMVALQRQIERDDLDDTTTDSGETAVKVSPLLAAQGQLPAAQMSASPAPPVQLPAAPVAAGRPPEPRPQVATRGSLHSIPEAPPSNPAASGMGSTRSSLPSLHNQTDARASYSDVRASYPDIRNDSPPSPRSFANPPLSGADQAEGGAGIPRGTLALAVLTAFAVGAAVGLLLAPSTPAAPTEVCASASAAPFTSSSVARAAPTAEEPSTQLKPSSEVIELDDPIGVATQTPPGPKAAPALTGKLPSGAYTGGPVPAPPKTAGSPPGYAPGSSNTGSSNTGSSNTGSSNTGSSNTGSSNTGSSNTGSSNTGPGSAPSPPKPRLDPPPPTPDPVDTFVP